MLIKTIFSTGELRDGRGKRTVIILIIIIIIINFSKHNNCVIIIIVWKNFPTNLTFLLIDIFVVGQNTVLSIHY